MGRFYIPSGAGGGSSEIERRESDPFGDRGPSPFEDDQERSGEDPARENRGRTSGAPGRFYVPRVNAAGALAEGGGDTEEPDEPDIFDRAGDFLKERWEQAAPRREVAAQALRQVATPAGAARLGLPLVGGAVGSVFGPVGAGVGAAWAGAIGEDLAQQYEIEQGQREAVDKGEVAIAGALSALPATTFGRLARAPGLRLPTRALLHGGEGAAQGLLDVTAMTGYQQGRLPTVEEAVPAMIGGGALGTGLGVGLGAVEGRA